MSLKKYMLFHWNQFLFPACECNESGSVDQNCDAHGICTCKENVEGDKCDIITPGHFDIDDPKGALLIQIGVPFKHKNSPNPGVTVTYILKISFGIS